MADGGAEGGNLKKKSLGSKSRSTCHPVSDESETATTLHVSGVASGRSLGKRRCVFSLAKR